MAERQLQQWRFPPALANDAAAWAVARQAESAGLAGTAHEHAADPITGRPDPPQEPSSAQPCHECTRPRPGRRRPRHGPTRPRRRPRRGPPWGLPGGRSPPVGHGRWRAAGPGVYRIAGTPVTWRSHLLAAVLAGGPGAVASHRSAGALHGLDGCRLGVPEVSVPRGRRYRPGGARVHESTTSTSPTSVGSMASRRPVPPGPSSTSGPYCPGGGSTSPWTAPGGSGSPTGTGCSIPS